MTMEWRFRLLFVSTSVRLNPCDNGMTMEFVLVPVILLTCGLVLILVIME